MTVNIVGWDIGGAHLKAAALDEQGMVIQVIQLPCPLWQGMQELVTAVNRVLRDLPSNPLTHAITMTGELVDLFGSREEGVTAIIAAMAEQLGDQEMYIYAGEKGFLSKQDDYRENIDSIASANWMASASLIANKVKAGLFIDVGSTTTDILAIDNYKLRAVGLTDYQRLRSAELIYTGIVRTTVMSTVQHAYFRGDQVSVMAENFATMADVYRVTGELEESHDQAATADGNEKTIIASAKRLSRMIGCEFDPDEMYLWRQFARYIREQQLLKIQQGCLRQLSRDFNYQPQQFIGAGIGRFLVKQLAQRLGFCYLDFTDLFSQKTQQLNLSIADCAPAAAIAYRCYNLLSA